MFNIYNHYQCDKRAKGHKFEPKEVEGRMGNGKLAMKEVKNQ